MLLILSQAQKDLDVIGIKIFMVFVSYEWHWCNRQSVGETFWADFRRTRKPRIQMQPLADLARKREATANSLQHVPCSQQIDCSMMME